MPQGRFITLEGGEGAGKTTQAALLEQTLAAQGMAVVRTREPGGSPGSEILRGLLIGGSVDWSPKADTLLHFAARAEHVAKTIGPALRSGHWVVCDRFYDSTMAYQGFGQGADRGFIAEQIRLLGLTPDLTIILDVPDSIASSRLRQRGGDADRYERLDADFHARVRSGFREIGVTDLSRCVILDGSGDEKAVHTDIMAAVWTRFPVG